MTAAFTCVKCGCGWELGHGATEDASGQVVCRDKAACQEREGAKWGTRAYHRLHPLTLTPEDMKKPLHSLVQHLRSNISTVRSQLQDARMGFGWEDRFKTAEEGLTLVIGYLYGVLQEIEKVQREDKP